MNNTFKIMWCDLTPEAQDRIFDSLNINLKLCFNAEEVHESYQQIKDEISRTKYAKADRAPAIKPVQKKTRRTNKYDEERTMRIKDFIKENDKTFGGKMNVRDIISTLGISVSKYYKLKEEATTEIKEEPICAIS